MIDSMFPKNGGLPMWHEELMDTITADMQVRDGCLEDMSAMNESERRKYIRSEIRRMYFNKGERLFRFTYWMRIRDYYPEKSPMWFLAKVMYKLCIRQTHLQVNCSPGKGFHVVHDSYSYLNAAEIGEYFTAYQGVTLGVDGKGGKPVIGNHVTVYTNAVICGDIKVGDNCVIGANAFVNRDLPANTTVVAQSTFIYH